MRKPVPNGADTRARFYVRQTADGRFAWRKGVGGLETPAATPGDAVNVALKDVGFLPAVIFWEGRTDAD
jgi:hypothetical protein